MVSKVYFNAMFILLLLCTTLYSQIQKSSSDEEAIKQVIINETNNWFNRDYENWEKNWVHAKYTFSMFSGYGDSALYREKLGWDSVKADAKHYFDKYKEPFDIDVSWSDWNFRIFNDCAWANYIQTNIIEENPYRNREVRFLEKNNGEWKIVYLASVNLFTYNFNNMFSSILEYNINDVGYKLLNEKKFKDAIDIFKKNVELYPKSSNAYDSLGEAYMVNGDKELAVENYKKSLELDPKNENAKSMLSKLAEN